MEAIYNGHLWTQFCKGMVVYRFVYTQVELWGILGVDDLNTEVTRLHIDL